MAAAIDYENSRWAAHTGIAALAAREDMTSTVVESLKAIDPGPIKVSALLTVSDVYRQKEEKDKSLEHLSNALDLCEEVPQLPARADGLNKAARRFHSLGDADKAREILRDNLSKTVASILDQSAKAKALVDIATSYDDLGLEISEEERAALAKIVAVS
jgi:tetratricopeptide (TPR) repeat protein